jgi:hypothetical protein
MTFRFSLSRIFGNLHGSNCYFVTTVVPSLHTEAFKGMRGSRVPQETSFMLYTHIFIVLREGEIPKGTHLIADLSTVALHVCNEEKSRN